MTSLPDSARAVLNAPALAHLVTLNPDGSPQVSIVWVCLDGDEIVAGHLPEHRKVRNIRNDSRVALSIETSKRNAIGLNEYLVIYGTARITEGGAAELLQKLAHTYLGPGPASNFPDCGSFSRLNLPDRQIVVYAAAASAVVPMPRRRKRQCISVRRAS